MSWIAPKIVCGGELMAILLGLTRPGGLLSNLVNPKGFPVSIGANFSSACLHLVMVFSSCSANGLPSFGNDSGQLVSGNGA